MVCAALLGLAAGEARAEGVVVVLGDSLTAGLGVAADEAFPARLQARLRADFESAPDTGYSGVGALLLDVDDRTLVDAPRLGAR